MGDEQEQNVVQDHGHVRGLFVVPNDPTQIPREVPNEKATGVLHGRERFVLQGGCTDPDPSVADRLKIFPFQQATDPTDELQHGVDGGHDVVSPLRGVGLGRGSRKNVGVGRLAEGGEQDHQGVDEEVEEKGQENPGLKPCFLPQDGETQEKGGREHRGRDVEGGRWWHFFLSRCDLVWHAALVGTFSCEGGDAGGGPIEQLTEYPQKY